MKERWEGEKAEMLILNSQNHLRFKKVLSNY